MPYYADDDHWTSRSANGLESENGRQTLDDNTALGSQAGRDLHANQWNPPEHWKDQDRVPKADTHHGLHVAWSGQYYHDETIGSPPPKIIRDRKLVRYSHTRSEYWDRW